MTISTLTDVIEILEEFTELDRALNRAERAALEAAGIAYLHYPAGLRAWINTHQMQQARKLIDDIHIC